MKRLTLLLVTWLCAVAVQAQSLPPLMNGDVDCPNIGAAKLLVTEYYKSGHYLEECKLVAQAAQDYLASNLQGPGKPALVLDIDETSLSNWEAIEKADYGYIPNTWSAWVQSAKAPAMPGTLALFNWARQHQVAIFFISFRGENEREASERNLHAAGYDGWQELVCFAGGPRPASAATFKSAARKRIVEQGYRIVVNMGDQRSDLEGGYAEGQFKLPNPMYYIP